MSEIDYEMLNFEAEFPTILKRRICEAYVVNANRRRRITSFSF